MGFRTAATDVREDWALSSCFMRLNMCLRVVLSVHSLLRLGPFSFPISPMLSRPRGPRSSGDGTGGGQRSNANSATHHETSLHGPLQPCQVQFLSTTGD